MDKSRAKRLKKQKILHSARVRVMRQYAYLSVLPKQVAHGGILQKL
jgi:hypothetical protein